MKIKKEYQIHSIAGENIVMFCGKKQRGLTRLLSLNSNAAWLWGRLAGIEFTEEDIICLLLSNFDIDLPTAISDVKRWIETLRRHQILQY